MAPKHFLELVLSLEAASSTITKGVAKEIPRQKAPSSESKSEVQQPVLVPERVRE